MFHNDFYFHIIANLISFFIIEQFVSYFSHINSNKRIYRLRIIYIAINCFLAVIPSFKDYIDSLLLILVDFSYICFLTRAKFSKSFILLLKYEIFNAIVAIVFGLLTKVLFLCFRISSSNELFRNHIPIIGLALFYVMFCLYINTKKLTSLGINTKFKTQFNFIFTLSIFALITLSVLIYSYALNESKIIPITFTQILIIVLLQSIYQSIISTLKNEVTQSVLLENERIEKDYYKKVNDSLQTLNTLKHDFKNHLSIINHYAKTGETKSLSQYLKKISDTIGNETIVRSPHSIVSSILSVKKQDCVEREIDFQHNLDFRNIYIADFDITTILGNLLDNAITAATKCDNPYVTITIHQIDSYLEINCRNNHQEILQKNKGVFLSTKKEQSILHGIGLKNIERTVKRINGNLQFDYDTNNFKVTIIFPNYES